MRCRSIRHLACILIPLTTLSVGCGESEGEKYYGDWRQLAPDVARVNVALEQAAIEGQESTMALARDFSAVRQRLVSLDPPETVQREQDALARALAQAQDATAGGATGAEANRVQDQIRRAESALDRAAADAPK